MGETNERCERLVNDPVPRKISKENNVALARWRHILNNIDYILAPRRFKCNTNSRVKSRTFLGADNSSDHDLVMMTRKLKL